MDQLEPAFSACRTAQTLGRKRRSRLRAPRLSGWRKRRSALAIMVLLLTTTWLVTSCAPAASDSSAASRLIPAGTAVQSSDLASAGEPSAGATIVPAAAATNDEIKLAILAPLSGVAPGFGASTRNGALLAVNNWNARGGVLGRRVLPVIEDSQCSPTAAAKAAHKVIEQDKVGYVVGEVCSGASYAIADVANAARVVQITPTSTEEGVTVDQSGKVKDYTFRACFIDSFQGTAAARFALEDLKARTAVIMTNQHDSYSTNLSEHFGTAFTGNGGVILSRETYGPQTTDLSATMARIAALHPDVVYLPDYYKMANLAARQAKENHVTAPLLGGDGWDSPDLDAQAAAGNYFTTHYASADPRPAVQQFVKDYESAYPGSQPDSLAALAYDATNLMLEGIQEAGVDDPVHVRDALTKIQFQAVTGSIRFDSQHDPVKPAAVMQVTPGGIAFRALVNP